MSRIMLINPNSTASMTEMALQSAIRVAHRDTVIEAVTCEGSPVSIEGYYDEAIAIPAMLSAIRAADGHDVSAFVIACFDDPGLHAARCIAQAPVVGLCQAAIQFATTLAARFTVVTTLPRSVPGIEDLVEAYGAGRSCQRVSAIDLPVLDLEARPQVARSRLVAAIDAAIHVDGAEAVVLGCAGMSHLCKELSAEMGLPVIDGVSAAIKLAEALAGAGLGTSKIGAYARPRRKGIDLTAVGATR